MDRRTFMLGSIAAASSAAFPAATFATGSGSNPKQNASANGVGFFSSHGLAMGIQLYMLGDEPKKDLDGTLTRVAAIGYKSIELPGIQRGAGARIRTAAKKAGMVISSLHVGVNPSIAQGSITLSSDMSELAAEMEALGAKDVVVPFPLLPSFKVADGETLLAAARRGFAEAGADHWKRTAALLNERGEQLQRIGLSLSYHNHNLEFLPVGSSSGWEILVAETDSKLVNFEVDVAWTAAGGLDPVNFIRGLSGRVRQLHVKDLRTIPPAGSVLAMESTEVGSGILDWKSILSAAYNAGVRQFYVEQEPPFQMDRFDAAAKSYAYLKGI